MAVKAVGLVPLGSMQSLQAIALWPFVSRELGADVPPDVDIPKPRGELLVTGRACQPGGIPRPACAVRACIGTVDKTLYVAGNRRWKDGIATDPEPFTEMPIRYENAFGGQGFASNPLGKGAAPVQTPDGEIHPLPNIELPDRLIRSPNDRPPPAGFGPYDLTWPQRFSKIGTYDGAWLKEDFPGFARDMDPSFFNTAPEDQQIQGFFRGDEPFRIENMHPTKPVLEGRLPGLAARVFINQKTDRGEVFREVPMHLETVHLFPHAERGILIFRGMIDVQEDDAADVLHLLAGCESLSAPKPVEHYRRVLEQRLDKDKGHLYALRDSDLMPARDPSAEPAPEDRSEMEALIKGEDLQRKHARRRMERELEKAFAQARSHGVDPEKLGLPLSLPPEEPEPSLEELPEFVERMEAEAEKQKAEAERRKAEAEAQARKACAEHGLDYDKMMAAQQAGGPPKLSATDEIRKAEQQLAASRSAGHPMPELESMLADPDFRKHLADSEEKLREAYRKMAHHFPAAARLDSTEAQRLREEVIAARREGRSLAGRDLTGADLSRLELQGADLRGAFLEGADLSGADLREANLSEAVLARADLTRADLSNANLEGANLGAAQLGHARLAGARMKDATLAKADLSWTAFEGADLSGADFMEAVFHMTDWTGIRAQQVTILETDLTGLVARGADLHKSVFVECSLEGADFAGADLTRSAFVTARADGASFRGAALQRACFAKESSLARADFRGANLEGAYAGGACLSDADLSAAELAQANFDGCDLQRSILDRANARGARFVRADLTGARLSRIDLMDAVLQKAKVGRADFDRANLFSADLSKATGDKRTNMRGANVKRARTLARRSDG